MSKKLARASATLKRPSTRSLASSKASSLPEDNYTFQSDDEDQQIKPTLLRKSLGSKRLRLRPAVGKGAVASRSSSSSSASEPEEKKRPLKRKYEKPVTRRASRLGSQTNTPAVSDSREKIKINSTPPILIPAKKRARPTKMLATPDEQQKTETENVMPSPAGKRRGTKKSTEENSGSAPALLDEKDLMQFGSPEPEDFSDDSVEFVWKGSSKMSIEILKRRIPKDEPREHYSASSVHSDPTAQRKRAIIPRLNNFDALSGKPIENSPSNDFDSPHADKGNDEKSRPRVYAVKSTTMKSRLQPADFKRPKWMNDQQGKSDDDDRHLSHPTEEEYLAKRAAYRGRGPFPVRRGTGTRGRPPGSRRHWNNDDDDDDYDQYEDNNTRYGPRKQLPYRPTRLSLLLPSTALRRSLSSRTHVRHAGWRGRRLREDPADQSHPSLPEK